MAHIRLSDANGMLERGATVLLALAMFATFMVTAACTENSDGFPGTYVAYGLINWGAFVLEPDGRASYESTYTTEDDTQARMTEEGTYRIVGDTAFITIVWEDGEESTLHATLRGDTLVIAEGFFAPLVRGRLP